MKAPSASPSRSPARMPTKAPSASPSRSPVLAPTPTPSASPTRAPNAAPSRSPSTAPTRSPAAAPTGSPTKAPSAAPAKVPTKAPSVSPSVSPYVPLSPTRAPVIPPTRAPSAGPAQAPSRAPSAAPSSSPAAGPTKAPSAGPSRGPAAAPTRAPSRGPSASPLSSPTKQPSRAPSSRPSVGPSLAPSLPGATSRPSVAPSTSAPSAGPSGSPAAQPTTTPSAQPSAAPSARPSARPSASPSAHPTTASPSAAPSSDPTAAPTAAPAPLPTAPPSQMPTAAPTATSPEDKQAAAQATPAFKFGDAPEYKASPLSSFAATPLFQSRYSPGAVSAPVYLESPVAKDAGTPWSRGLSSPSFLASPGFVASPWADLAAAPTAAVTPLDKLAASPVFKDDFSPAGMARTPEGQRVAAPEYKDTVFAGSPVGQLVAAPGYKAAPLSQFAETPLFRDRFAPATVAAPVHAASPLARDRGSPFARGLASPSFLASPEYLSTPAADIAGAPTAAVTPLEKLAASPLFKEDFSPAGMARTPQGVVMATPEFKDAGFQESPVGKLVAAPLYKAAPLSQFASTPLFSDRFAPSTVAAPVYLASPLSRDAASPRAADAATPAFKGSPMYIGSPRFDAANAPSAAVTPLEKLAAAPLFQNDFSPTGRHSTPQGRLAATPEYRDAWFRASPVGEYATSPRYQDAPLVRLAETPAFADRFSPSTVGSPLYLSSPQSVVDRSPWSKGAATPAFRASPAFEASPEGKLEPTPSAAVTPLEKAAAAPLLRHYLSPEGKAETPEIKNTPSPTVVEGLGAAEKEEARSIVEPISNAGPVAGLAVGFAAGGNAGKLAVLTSVSCTVEDVDLAGAEPIDWEFHPIGAPVGSHYHRYFLGALIFNLVILVGLLAILLALAGVMVSFFKVPFLKACGSVKCPGMVFIPMMFLMQGTSLAASNMSFFPQRAPGAVAALGWIGLCLCAATPLLLWWLLLRPSRFNARLVPAPRLEGNKMSGWKRSAYMFTFGKKVWTTGTAPGSPEDFFVERWGPVFESYREGFQWFGCVELSSLLGLSIFAAWQPAPGAGCHARNFMMVAFLGGYLALIVIKKPYLALLDHIISTFLAGAMFAAVFSIALSIYLSEAGSSVPFLSQFAVKMLLISCFVMLFKALYDLSLLVTESRIDRNRERRFSVAKALDDEDTALPLVQQSLGSDSEMSHFRSATPEEGESPVWRASSPVTSFHKPSEADINWLLHTAPGVGEENAPQIITAARRNFGAGWRNAILRQLDHGAVLSRTNSAGGVGSDLQRLLDREIWEEPDPIDGRSGRAASMMPPAQLGLRISARYATGPSGNLSPRAGQRLRQSSLKAPDELKAAAHQTTFGSLGRLHPSAASQRANPRRVVQSMAAPRQPASLRPAAGSSRHRHVASMEFSTPLSVSGLHAPSAFDGAQPVRRGSFTPMPLRLSFDPGTPRPRPPPLNAPVDGSPGGSLDSPTAGLPGGSKAKRSGRQSR
eukprot:TRINITY_DN4351_c0_g2_i1.p1 TRINITY_DN4351_c0_g2~~TRINITY_DN4351_c0_g2_i1.p1  ORF type:complete len:1489 (+),score=423.54 TRINITY_DN4351_c0_g2_i1:2-4468(+)